MNKIKELPLQQKYSIMSLLERNIPSYIYRKSNLILLVVFTAIFALLFINLYEPFNSTEWYNISKFEYFSYSSLLILTGVLIVVISRLIMYYYTKKRAISYWMYLLCVLLEILCMAAIYALISYFLDKNSQYIILLKASIKNTGLVILLPYLIMHLYFAFEEKNKLLQQLKEASLSGGDSPKSRDIISFYDNKNELRLSIKMESLLYIESADNYLEIWYLDKHGVCNYLLRNTLKNIEDKFSATNIIRCHRSYMVNFNQVKIAKKTKNGIYLDLDIERVPQIPVSKSYGDKVGKWLISSM